MRYSLVVQGPDGGRAVLVVDRVGGAGECVCGHPHRYGCTRLPALCWATTSSHTVWQAARVTAWGRPLVAVSYPPNLHAGRAAAAHHV